MGLLAAAVGPKNQEIGVHFTSERLQEFMKKKI